MCGDGANDCGALRAAHAGISLSELESSVAAPFTSTQPDVSCVTRVLREGRAALTTSFGVFKFMIAYSLTEFFSVAFLYFFDANLTDFQFLYIDVALIVNFAFFFGMTEAYTGKLCGIPPLTSLLGLVPLLSLIGQMVLVAIAQYVCYYFLTTFPWYVRHTYQGEEANECWENYAIFTVSMFQYITQAVVFSHGSPYRRSVVTNRHLMISFVVMTALCVYITVIPPEWLSRFLELRMPKDSLLSYVIILVAMIQFIIALLFERVVIEYLMEGKQMIPKFLKEKRVRKTPHLMIRRQLTDMDYLEYSNGVSFDKETVTVSDCSSGKSR
jgi:magnesium-transporting ATPase (P-type)